LGGFRGQDNEERVRMSRGTACFNRHQKYPQEGHGVSEITKNDFRAEIKTYTIAYTHQGVSGGAGIFFGSAPLRTGRPAGIAGRPRTTGSLQ
jgi:hypothetical protein